MKLPNEQNDISISDSFNEYEEIINKNHKNNELFARKYLPELNKNDLNEILDKETNDIIKNYVRNQLSNMNNDNYIYGNKKFLENVQKCTESEKVLYFYQKNFLMTINIIKQIFKNLNENIEIIPEEIRIIC